MENRNYIIDRLKAKTVTIDEFNYDSLQAPPIAVMFTPMDIAQLNQIAKSIKYAAKPQIKYQEIDKIMRRRGFVKFAAGTNRVVYRPLESNTFLVKVAYDAVGLGDNPKEFRNQFIFKPFVAKCFEVTPCGTLGVFERVNPITSREEFISVASDIFEVVNSWFIGEYVLEDIGTKYFMNYGIRTGFGPVLLDYPYCYKLDGNKLFCNAPSDKNPSGCCEGVIDYDPGFNFLYCTKCGVKYKAKELEEAIKENEVIVKSEGDVKMKVSIKGGSKNVNTSVNLGEHADLAKSMPTKPLNKKKREEEAKTVYPSIKAHGSTRKLNNVPEVKEEKVEVVTEPTPIPEAVPEVSVSDQRTNREIISPISFDESLLNQVERFKMIIEDAFNLFEKVSDEDAEEICKVFNKFLEDKFNSKLVDIDDYNKMVEEKSEDTENVEEIDSEEPNEMILLRAGHYINMVLDEVDDECFCKFVLDLGEEAVKRILSASFSENGICYISFNNVSLNCEEYEDKGKLVVAEIKPQIIFNNSEVTLDLDNLYFGVAPKDIVPFMPECGYNVFEQNKTYNGCKLFPAKVINVKDVFPSSKPNKVVVIIDKDGNYLTMEDGNILAIDMIDDKSFDSLSIVSAEWLNKTLEEKTKVEEQLAEKELIKESSSDNGFGRVIEDVDNTEFYEESSIPTGVLPPTNYVEDNEDGEYEEEGSEDEE